MFVSFRGLGGGSGVRPNVILYFLHRPLFVNTHKHSRYSGDWHKKTLSVLRDNSSSSRGSERDLDMRGKGTNLKIVCRAKHTASGFAGKLRFAFEKSYHHQGWQKFLFSIKLNSLLLNPYSHTKLNIKLLMNFITGTASDGEVDDERKGSENY